MKFKKRIGVSALRGAALAATAAMLTLTASAEGYQVNTLSTRQLGMGHTGIGLKLGAESQFFNPAGMGYMTAQGEVSGSFNATFATCTAIHDGERFSTDNKAATPFSVFAAASITKDLKVGLSLYTPYGSSIDWTDNWPGSTLSQSVKLQSFCFQPTVAYRFLDRFSAGAGLMLTWGNVDLHKGLISGAQLDGMLGMMGVPPSYGHITPASVALQGNAHVAVGVNLGLMADITDNVTAGLTFRSKQMLKVKAGKSEVSYAVSNPVILGILSEKLDGISKAEFAARMPLPATLGFGASWHNDRVKTALETQLTFWSAYKQLDINFAGLPQFDQSLPKNYHDSWLVRAGVEWAATKRLDLRAGLMVDFSPCDKNYYNPETPGMTKIEPSVGLTFRPADWLGINAAVMYVAGTGVNGASYPEPNVLTGKTDNFTADYRVHATVASLGVSFRF